MNEKKEYKCGFVAIIGRPNVGKSTLLNTLLGQKVAIVTPVPQTTRTLIRGILTEARGQIIFVDTPGIYLAKDRLGKYMNVSASGVIEDSDVVIHLVDSSEPVGKEEQMVVNKLAKISKPVIVGFNKIDLKGKFIQEYIKLWEDVKRKPVSELGDSLIMLPISGLHQKNTKELIDILFSLLPEGEQLYPTQTVSDVPAALVASDIIREKLFAFMREEIPYSLAVFIEEMVERSKKLLFIRAAVFIERDSQRRMVIGKHAAVIKKAGMLARLELEAIFKKKVYLELYAKTQKSWRDDSRLLQLLGYRPQQ